MTEIWGGAAFPSSIIRAKYRQFNKRWTKVRTPELGTRTQNLKISPNFIRTFWPICIRKTDLGPDLGNFYPDAGYGFFPPR